MDDTAVYNIELPGGLISAEQSGGIVVAHGVKYATAGRFETPQPFTRWNSTLDCTKPAVICPQLPSRLDVLMGPIAKGRKMLEDCLNVTIAAPVPTDNAILKPVMVFLHGGAYVSGAGDLGCYDNVGLAAKDVVVVNVTYRLGIFGYLPIQGIAPANLGLLDQLEALRWVHNNIRYFGGDSSRVCLLGESAGADSVLCLMATDEAAGLFHRVIIQSAPFGLRQQNRQPMTEALSSLARDLLAENPNAPSADEMLAIQHQLTTVGAKFRSGGMPFGPIIGCAPLPSNEAFAAKIEAAASRLPILVGYTANEGKAFTPAMEAAQAYFNLPFVGWILESFTSWVITKWIFQWPAEKFYKRAIQLGGKASIFRFSWSPAQTRFRAAHTIELPFLFGSWENWKNAPMLSGDGSHDVFNKLGREVKSLWSNFAKGLDLENSRFEIDENFSFRDGKESGRAKLAVH